MKKVGICACYNTRNYGSMLQALATQVKIEQMGYDSEFIIYKKKRTPLFILKQIPRVLNKNLMMDKFMVVQKKIKLYLHPLILEQETIREKAFVRFQNKYFRHFSNINYGYKQLCNSASEYACVVVGSDQLWTPGGLATNFYNLMFVPDNVKKVSYATSFGVNEIPRYQRNRTKRFLERIDYLSVREIRGAEIVGKIADCRAKVVVDPTLLLTSNEWDDIIPDRNIVKEKYIFCYFLGKNLRHRELAIELSKKTCYKIVSTPFLDSFVKSDINFGDYRLFDIGPGDFVNLIRHAEFVITDSFHGTVFSLMYHKKFITVDRFLEGTQSRNSRIDSLCSLLGLEKRRFQQDIYKEMLEPISFDLVENKLYSLRKESIDYLKTALDS